MIKVIIVFLILFFTYSITYTQTIFKGYGKCYPFDAGYLNEEFETFINELTSRLEEKDTHFIYSVFDKNIECANNLEGLDNFKDYVNKFIGVETFCNEMLSILHLGCYRETYLEEGYIFPSFERHLRLEKITELGLFESLDMHNTAVIIGENVPIYSEPNNNNIVEYLSYEIVKYDRNYNNDGWERLISTDSKVFYVENQFIYKYMGGYILIIEKKESKWIITEFYAS